jgi:phosphate starvation-inducible PhoH-like protein
MSRKRKEKFMNERQVRPAFNVVPKTEKQDFLMRAIEQKTLIIASGCAGTGKTYCAGMMAAKLLLKGEASNIVLTRANVPTGRSLGSFPGTVEEKMAPWLAPITSVLSQGLGRGDFECRMGKSIHIQPIETIRGQSFAHSIILVDEAQNLTFEEIKAITTRIGEGSKLILMGDPDQSDVKNGNDLMKFATMCYNHDIDVPVIEFTVNDIVRSDIVADLVRMFYSES